MKYRFLINGQTVDRGQASAKRFAASVPLNTPVVVENKGKLIDMGSVEDIWDLPNESYTEKLNRKITKK